MAGCKSCGGCSSENWPKIVLSKIIKSELDEIKSKKGNINVSDVADILASSYQLLSSPKVFKLKAQQFHFFPAIQNLFDNPSALDKFKGLYNDIQIFPHYKNIDSALENRKVLNCISGALVIAALNNKLMDEKNALITLDGMLDKLGTPSALVYVRDPECKFDDGEYNNHVLIRETIYRALNPLCLCPKEKGKTCCVVSSLGYFLVTE